MSFCLLSSGGMLETPGSQMIPTTGFRDRNTEETQTLQPQRQPVVITQFENCRIQKRVGEPTRLETCPFLDIVIGRSSARQIFNPPQKLEVEGLLSIARPALPSTFRCPSTLPADTRRGNCNENPYRSGTAR